MVFELESYVYLIICAFARVLVLHESVHGTDGEVEYDLALLSTTFLLRFDLFIEISSPAHSPLLYCGVAGRR